MDKELLENLVNNGYSQRQIANKFDCSQSTIKYWVKKHKISKYVRTQPTECDLCGNNIKSYDGRNRRRCGSCNTRIRRYRTKIKAIEYLGGSCNRCGWKGNIAAFEFHHIHGDKEFSIGSANNRRWEYVEVELKKCELLCSNCHRIEHSKYDTDDAFMDVVNRKKL